MTRAQVARAQGSPQFKVHLTNGGGQLGREGRLAVLRRSGIVFAFTLSVVSGFAQSCFVQSSFAQSSPSPSAPQMPLRGFVPPFEILRTVRAAGFEPLAPPLREGTSYVVRAIDFRGVAMRVVVDARSGAIRDANRIVAGPGLYGPYMPGPYAPVYGRLAAPPTYLPPDDIEPSYGRPPYVGTTELSPSDRRSSGLSLVPLPRPRPASLAATGTTERKPAGRPDVAISAPRAPQSEQPDQGSIVSPIND